MVTTTHPAKKEKYFSLVDCLVPSPTQDQVLVTTNFGRKVLVDIETGGLSGSSCGDIRSSKRIHSYSEKSGRYALATSAGVGLCTWSELMSVEKCTIRPDTSFYSTCWTGENVIAGGDGGVLVQVDSKTGAVVRDFRAHSGSVNAIKDRDNNCFLSAGADGTCRMWDGRSGEITHKLSPASWQAAKRSTGASHITCLDVWEDWVVCGGGPNLTLWYLKEDTGVAVMDVGDMIPSVVRFSEDSIVVAGNASHLLHWSLAGKLKYKVASQLDTITDVITITGKSGRRLLLAAGAPTQLNVFLDPGYLSHTLDFLED